LAIFLHLRRGRLPSRVDFSKSLKNRFMSSSFDHVLHFSFLVFKDSFVAGFSPHLHVSMPTLEKLADFLVSTSNLSSDKPWNNTEYSGLVSSAVLELNQRYYSTTDDAALERGAVDLIGGNCRDEYAMLYSLE
jgi:hypothetical protein